MPEELLREIRKLEVRLENFIKSEEEFVKELRLCLEKFEDLNDGLKILRGKPDPQVEDLATLRLEAVKAFYHALKKGSGAAHEQSHLLESYGGLVLALEEEVLMF